MFRRENLQTLRLTFAGRLVGCAGGKERVTSRYRTWAIGWTVGPLIAETQIVFTLGLDM